mgnify:FL=1
MGTKQYDSATDLLTFSRASGGTALSKISYGNELVINGTFDSDLSGWTTAGTGSMSIVNNQLVATKGSTGWNNTAVYAIPTVAGGVYTVSVDLVGASGQAYAIISPRPGYYTPELVRVADNDPVGDTYTNTFVAVSNTSYLHLLPPYNAGHTSTWDNISVKEVLFGQADGTLQVFNHGNNIPRIEYDATGAVKGLLIEEARTNRILTSEVAPTSYFGGLTKSVDNSVVSPAGGNNVEKFTLSNANDYHYVGNHHDICTGTGTSTYSIFAKGSGHNLIRLRMSNMSGSPSCDFDLSTGQKQVTSSSDSSVTGAIESIGNGWWRCAMTYTAVKSNPYASVFLIDAMDAPIQTFQGDGTSSVYVWGSQYESGSFPTSYIPTTGAPATRASDIAEIPTSAFGYNNDKGSLVIDVLTPVADQLIPLAIFNTSNYHHSRSLWKSNYALNGAGDYFKAQAHDTVAAQTTNQALTQQTQAGYTKLGLSYGDSERAVRDGGTVVSGDSRSPTPTRLHLGGRDNGFQSQCWIKSIQYYPRQLTDTQLQELTT